MTSSENPPVTEAVVNQIATVLDGEITAAQVNRVLTTWNALQEGEPVGTIRVGPAAEVAHRVELNGLPLWHITAVDGSWYNDTRPSLPDWQLISSDAQTAEPQ